MARILALALVLSVPAACARPPRALPASGGGAITAAAKRGEASRLHPLVGVWRVARFCYADSAGKPIDPFSLRPTGWFIYAPGGQLSIHVGRTPPVRSASAPGEATDAELRELDRAYFGYYGTYTITSDTTVVHHVQGGTVGRYNLTDQPREFRLRGDTLHIGGDRETRHCRILVRER